MFLQYVKNIRLVQQMRSAISGGHICNANEPAMLKQGLCCPILDGRCLQRHFYSLRSHVVGMGREASKPRAISRGLQRHAPLSSYTLRCSAYQTSSAHQQCSQDQQSIPTTFSRSHSQSSILSPPSSSSPPPASRLISTTTTSSGVRGVQDGTPKYTMSYVQGGLDPPLMGKTLGQCMDDMAEQKPDHSAFVFVEEGVRWTFSQFREEVDRLSAGFLAIGLKKGDRIGIWASNTSEWVLTQFAAARIGAILVTINLAYRPNELYYTLLKAGVKAIVSAQNFKTQDYYEMLSTVCPELATSSPGRLRSQKLPMLESVIMLGKGDFPGAYMFDDVIDMGTSEHKVMVEDCAKTVQFDDPIAILFTSGTTGNPKGATMTHHRLVNNGYHIGCRVGFQENDHVMCLPIPLYHIFASVGGPLVGITHGATNVYPTAGYEPVATLKAIQDERCTVLYGTPTMFIDMMNQPVFKELDVSSLYSSIIGGAPVSPELLRQMTKGMGFKYIAVGYGMTESGPMIGVTNEDDPEEKKLNTVGKLCQHMEAKVIDPETSQVVPVGVPGELCVRGYCNMIGYWENEEATKATIDATNWLHSGDLATLDEDGYIRIVGRIKELIIAGGRNIYPVEIEKFIHTHPKVEDVHVIGIPDDRLGEKVVACIRGKAKEELTQEDIIDYCKGEISHYKIPSHVVFMDVFPMTVSGKVQKFKLQEIVIEQLK
ncbi:medium-chain acyl-CoA ligase ACSF2, mitochondrial-like isoform X1 [Lytechinus pictus]|uniref:medium-chain acyl-CoA ligase ACSF2, mitochondrial-like isoform X1 n=2 Tax=Lytechinus pictus TaxID=7653 RepID=UPI0030BA1B07